MKRGNKKTISFILITEDGFAQPLLNIPYLD
jgi:hypothetical protein